MDRRNVDRFLSDPPFQSEPALPLSEYFQQRPADSRLPPSGRRSPPLDSYKTSMCHAWLASATCSFGENCRFAHGEHELRPLRHSQNRPTRRTDNERVPLLSLPLSEYFPPRRQLEVPQRSVLSAGVGEGSEAVAFAAVATSTAAPPLFVVNPEERNPIIGASKPEGAYLEALLLEKREMQRGLLANYKKFGDAFWAKSRTHKPLA